MNNAGPLIWATYAPEAKKNNILRDSANTLHSLQY